MDDYNTKGTIYKIENLVNGKVYVGQTIKDPYRRMQTHLVCLRGRYHINRHLQNAFNKYGEDSFAFEIMENCTVEEIDDKEIRWISHYKKSVGSYNIELGGNKRKVTSKETKRRLSVAGKQSYQNPDILRKRKEQWNKIKGENHFNNKSVICLNDNQVFYSITEAGKYYGINMKAISQALSERNPYCRSADGKKKLEFSFYEEGESYIRKNHVHKQSIPVRCKTTGEIFNSVREACDKYNLYTTNISKVCKGKQKSTGKLSDGTKLEWEYCPYSKTL